MAHFSHYLTNQKAKREKKENKVWRREGIIIIQLNEIQQVFISMNIFIRNICQPGQHLTVLLFLS